MITSVVEKKNNLNEQNFEVYWKTRSKDRRWRMMGREGKSVKTVSRQKNVVPEIVVPKSRDKKVVTEKVGVGSKRN